MLTTIFEDLFLGIFVMCITITLSLASTKLASYNKKVLHLNLLNYAVGIYNKLKIKQYLKNKIFYISFNSITNLSLLFPAILSSLVLPSVVNRSCHRKAQTISWHRMTNVIALSWLLIQYKLMCNSRINRQSSAKTLFKHQVNNFSF